MRAFARCLAMDGEEIIQSNPIATASRIQIMPRAGPARGERCGEMGGWKVKKKKGSGSPGFELIPTSHTHCSSAVSFFHFLLLIVSFRSDSLHRFIWQGIWNSISPLSSIRASSDPSSLLFLV